MVLTIKIDDRMLRLWQAVYRLFCIRVENGIKCLLLSENILPPRNTLLGKEAVEYDGRVVQLEAAASDRFQAKAQPLEDERPGDWLRHNKRNAALPNERKMKWVIVIAFLPKHCACKYCTKGLWEQLSRLFEIIRCRFHPRLSLVSIFHPRPKKKHDKLMRMKTQMNRPEQRFKHQHIEQDCSPRRTPQLRLSSLRTKLALGNTLLFRFSQLQLRCSTSISGPQASSPRSELSAKRAVANVIDFCRADRNLSSKSLACYFQSKKRKSEVFIRS